jgi:hypothetical protein
LWHCELFSNSENSYDVGFVYGDLSSVAKIEDLRKYVERISYLKAEKVELASIRGGCARKEVEKRLIQSNVEKIKRDRTK